MTATPPRVTIYARQSKDSQAGIDRQLEDCQRECQRRGWDNPTVIVDNDESADSKRRRRADYRPGYKRLLADMEHGATDVVIVQDQDRLMRDVREGEDLIELVEKTKVRVVFTRAGEVDLNTVDGRMHVRLKAVIARQETEKKAERQKRAAEQAAEQCVPSSRRAFGYRAEVIRDSHGRVVDRRNVEDPAEAAVVREAFRMLAEGRSLVAITKMMNDSGLPSVRGNQWSRKGVRYLLMSPRYCGWRVFRGEVVTDDHGQPRVGDWPTLVTVEDHVRAVKLLEEPDRKATGYRGTARRWLGSGLFLCGRCGFDVRTGRRTYDNTRTYICREHAHLSRAADPVDALVVALVEGRLAQPDAANLLAGQDVPELAELRAERDRLQAKIARAVRDYDDEVIDGATLRSVKARREAELRVLERKIGAAAQTSRLAALGAAPDPVEAFRGLDLNVRREVIDLLMTVTLLPAKRGRSTFDPETVRITWKGTT